MTQELHDEISQNKKRDRKLREWRLDTVQSYMVKGLDQYELASKLGVNQQQSYFATTKDCKRSTIDEIDDKATLYRVKANAHIVETIAKNRIGDW